jgi:hypothetical protein
MATCHFCGSSILFGGVTDGEMRFCNQDCHNRGFLMAVADQVPPDVLQQHVQQVHGGKCPKCQGPGPIDVHTYHTVWSILLLTQWNSSPEVCCNSCGVKSKLYGMLFSGVLGWWGFPWGIILTPVQVGRNFFGLFSSPNPQQPSPEMLKLIKLQLAADMLADVPEEENDTNQAV